MEIYIAVDIGGTNIRVASFQKQGNEQLDYLKIKTRKPGYEIFPRLAESIRSVIKPGYELAGICTAVPGPFDIHNGVIWNTPNIPEWNDFDLRNRLEELFGTKVLLINDANAGAYGEWKFGAGRTHSNLIYLTISTGVGSGIIVNNQLLLGSQGLGAELGHITIEENGPMCSCGQLGHLEAYSSGTAVAKWVVNRIIQGEKSSLSSQTDITVEIILEHARNGDDLAVRAFHRAGNYIGFMLRNALHIFNPSKIILGGGLMNSGELILNPIRKSISTNLLTDRYIQNFEITIADLGDQAGLMGALAYIQDQEG